MFKFMRKMSPNFTREKSFCIKRMAPGWFLLTVLYPALASAQVSELWVARYHGSVDGSNDAAVAMALDKAGNVYITGQSSGAGTGIDYATVAYDQQPDPHHHFVFFTAIAVDTKSRVYVTGSISIFGGYETHFRTVSYDQTGTHLWADQPIFGFRFGGANAIALGNAANVYIVGSIVDDASGRSLYVTLGYGDQPVLGPT